MNRKWLLVAFILGLAFTACKKEEPIDPDPTVTPETSVTFTCMDTTARVPNVLVGISPSASDRDAGIFIRSGTTDNQGKIKFSTIDPQIIYYSASRTLNGNIIQRKGEVEIEKDKKKYVTVNF